MSNHSNEKAQIESLERYCSSDSLSLDGIKCAIEFFVCHDFLNGSVFFHRICINPKVTLEIVEYLVELFPDELRISCSSANGDYKNALPLHMACMNKGCPHSVLKFLIEHYCSSASCVMKE